ncbi:MAG TPA: hypothetical protein DHW45_12105 [Candidatus Latescibacteria bacterium]|nr:hypothetical protein [Candidatus Latescibacterota bacterium]
MDITLLVHSASTWSMVGLIWLIQIVHYPLFAHVGSDCFSAYQRLHIRRMSWVAGLLMLTEGATGAYILLVLPRGLSFTLATLGFALLLVIWGSTLLLQIPYHRTLSSHFDKSTHASLIKTNWIRTIGWTCRGLLVLSLLATLD